MTVRVSLLGDKIMADIDMAFLILCALKLGRQETVGLTRAIVLVMQEDTIQDEMNYVCEY